MVPGAPGSGKQAMEGNVMSRNACIVCGRSTAVMHRIRNAWVCIAHRDQVRAQYAREDAQAEMESERRAEAAMDLWASGMTDAPMTAWEHADCSQCEEDYAAGRKANATR